MQVFRVYAFDADDISFYVPMSQSDWMRLQTYMRWHLYNQHTVSAIMFPCSQMLTNLSFDASDWRVAKSYQNTATPEGISIALPQVHDQVRPISIAALIIIVIIIIIIVRATYTKA